MGQAVFSRQGMMKMMEIKGKVNTAFCFAKVIEDEAIKAYQASKRGGYLDCVLLDNGRIVISGEAALVAVTEIVAELKKMEERKNDAARMQNNRTGNEVLP